MVSGGAQVTRRILPLIVLLLGLATIAATFAFSLLADVRAAYPDGEFSTALTQFQRAASLADIASVLSNPQGVAAQVAAARLDLFVYLPLYGLFLLTASAMLAQGVRRLEFWAPALLIGVGLIGDIIETTAQLRILAAFDFAGENLASLQLGSQLKLIGLTLGAVAIAAIAFFKPRRNWLVFATGIAVPVLLALDITGFMPLGGFAVGAGLFFLALIVTAAWRVFRPPAPEDAPAIPMPQRVLRSLAGARWPLAIGVAGAAAALALHAHRETSLRALPPAAAAISAVAIADDGAFFAVASEDGEIEIWRWGGREPLRIVNPDGPARHMLFDTVTEEGAPTRQRLVFSTALGRVRGVDAETGAPLLRDDAFPAARTAPLLAAANDEVFAAGADSNDAPFVVALGASGARRLDLEVGQAATPTMLRRTLNSLSVLLGNGQVVVLSMTNPDGSRVDRQRVERAWMTAREVGTIAAYEAFLRENPSGPHLAEARAALRRLVDADQNGGLEPSDLARLSDPAILAEPESDASGYAVGLQSASGPADASSVGVALSDSDPGALVLVTGGEAVLERDGQRTSLGECQGEVVESHFVMVFGAGNVSTWYFVTADGFLCVVREANREWTLETTQLVASPITAASLRMGQFLLGLPSGEVRVVDITGRTVGRLEGHRDAVRAIAMTPDGRRAISGAADGTILAFDVTPSRAPVYTRPAAVLARAREDAVTQWAELSNRVAPIGADAPGRADAIAGAWARTVAECANAESAVLVRIEDGAITSSQGEDLQQSAQSTRISNWTQTSQIERVTEREGALSVRTTRGTYALTSSLLTIRDATNNVNTPLTRCGPSPAWVEWLGTVPQRAVEDAEIEAAAARLGTEADVIRAVAMTRTDAEALAARNRTTILFFPNNFSRLTDGRFDGSNPDVSRRAITRADISLPQDQHWERLKAAMALDAEAALGATQWGPFLLLGRNFSLSGFSTAAEYVESMVVRGEHVAAFEGFVVANGLADELQRKEWRRFAERYAGPGAGDTEGAMLERVYAMLPIRRDPEAFVESLRGPAGRRVLGAADIGPAAQRLGVDAPALLAVATVATGSGDAFGADGLPITRFDPEVFSRLTGGRYNQSNPQVSQSTATGTARNLNHQQRWALVREALALDPDAALRATLWGTYRISGSEFASLGFDSPLAMVRDAAQAPERQVAQFEARVRALGLADELQRRDWAAFAQGYFGAGATTVSSRELGQVYANLGGRAAAVANVDMSYLDNLVAQTRAPLTRTDFEAVATELGVEWQALAAIAEAESGPLGGFAADGRPIILFERHLFSRKTNSRFDASNPNISNRTAGGYPRTQAERWAQVREAFALDPEAALQSVSYGRYQMLGQHFASMSMPDARSYVALLARSERDQLNAFAAFLRANNMVDEIQRRDWAGFARLYNGPAYAQSQADTRIANAYARIMGTQ